ncbi:hypothetical protein CB1_000039001 [Camelus ferus]|nr:hypothetical protein CB1_000039001 [Camelus ferus]
MAEMLTALMFLEVVLRIHTSQYAFTNHSELNDPSPATTVDVSYRLDTSWNVGVYREACCGWWIQGNWAEFFGWISVMDGLPPYVEIGLGLFFGKLCKFDILLLPKDLSSRLVTSRVQDIMGVLSWMG